MEKLQRDFLESLITAPSPAGYEQPVRQVYHAYTESFADDVRSDVHGNMIAAPEGVIAQPVNLFDHAYQLVDLRQPLSDAGFGTPVHGIHADLERLVQG